MGQPIRQDGSKRWHGSRSQVTFALRKTDVHQAPFKPAFLVPFEIQWNRFPVTHQDSEWRAE